jgi:hypothetical protein
VDAAAISRRGLDVALVSHARRSDEHHFEDGQGERAVIECEVDID